MEKNLNALFLDTLKDIYYAEKQIASKNGEGRIVRQTESGFWKASWGNRRPDRAVGASFRIAGQAGPRKKMWLHWSILDEGKEIMEEYEDEPALDAGLLAAAQAGEHYGISRYGTLRSWAAKLSMKDAVKAARPNAGRRKTDDALTKLADSEVNAVAQAA
jgi:ferritin-like metal-binding protein YciE